MYRVKITYENGGAEIIETNDYEYVMILIRRAKNRHANIEIKGYQLSDFVDELI